MKKTGAYFTVEAVMVLPMVFGVILMTIYLLFFRYDRCLLEQDAGKIAMRGCTIQNTDSQKLADELLTQSGKLDQTRYLAFEFGETTISLKGSRVIVKRTGSLRYPFAGMFLEGEQDIWTCGVCIENHRISPVAFVRNCRKIMGGK